MSDRVWYLKKCELFERLNPSDLGVLESSARVRTFPKKSVVYLPQDAANSVYVVAEGRIRLVSITPEGKEAILAFFEPGDLFGELALLDAEPREEYAEAVLPSTVIAIPRESVEEVMGCNSSLTLAITKLIGWRRKKLERRLRNLLFRSNRERLSGLLWELTERYGRRIVEGLLIDIKLSHQDLAGLIGVTRESVTLALGELQSEGVISVGRQRIVVLNVTQLAKSAGETPKPPYRAEANPHSPAGQTVQ
ncbi:MAG: Crp/Fnr family transcriptional regulator [Planctomycetaceae bacterium]|nr:Crp/Fnr family transcriptional regulator [Planctomycetaceae bacterium]